MLSRERRNTDQVLQKTASGCKEEPKKCTVLANLANPYAKSEPDIRSEIVNSFLVLSLDLVRSPAVAPTPYFLW
jgi:hypothetical protein